MKKILNDEIVKFLQQITIATKIELEAISKFMKLEKNLKRLITNTKNTLERLLKFCQNLDDERNT